MKHRFHLDYSGIEALLLPEPSDQASSLETGVAIERRGVKLDWIFKFIRACDAAIEDVWARYESHERAYEHLNWSGNIPEGEPPKIRRQQNLDGHFLKSQIISPLTKQSKTALYSRIPEEALGEPTVFVSHAWDDTLGYREGTTLIEMTSSARDSVGMNTNCWIDLFVYNQHVPQDVAQDMEHIIGSIGTLVMPMPSDNALGRLWCLWEWLCAYRTGIPIKHPELATDRYYFGRKRRWFDESFKSVEQASTGQQEDRIKIMDAIIQTFGSVEKADETIRTSAESQFTKYSDAPWRKY